MQHSSRANPRMSRENQKITRRPIRDLTKMCNKRIKRRRVNEKDRTFITRNRPVLEADF